MKRFIYYLMALLGFGAQGCDKLENAFGGEEVCMYGTPIVEFHLSARVVDKDGNPIQGIEVRPNSGIPCLNKTGFSDYLGVINAYYHDTGFAGDIHEVIFYDVDGVANGGEFAKLKLDISDKVTKIEEGDGWNQGSYKADIGDVVLTLKSETNEEVEDKAYRITLSVTVVNEAGEPIQGILVRPESGDFAGREGYTDHLGTITTSSYIESVDGRFVLQFKDVDGEYNLGEYENIDLDITDRVLAVATEYGSADVALGPVVMKKK